MSGLWLLIAIICSRYDCSTEVVGQFSDKAACLDEADRRYQADWKAPGFGCQQKPVVMSVGR